MIYGPNCASNCSSRHCKTPSSTCDRETGQCPGWCEDGWTEIDCSKTCTSMMYGPNCASNCSSRHCKTPTSTCDRVTGQCPDGCEDGWTEIDCSGKCKPGTFGRDCSRCGHCDVTCNDGDGRCPGECLDGFTGDRCDVDVRVSPVTTGVIGGAIGVAVMLLIGGLMIWLLKSGRLKWIPTTTTDPQELRKTDTPNTGEISTHAPTSDVKDQDYTELNEFTREKNKSPYDVIQNETNQI
ncbi:platelet endothelial aggregation receptor 1-like [Haliotis rufescens]|uniref:platelet endothelial aggregation receptor 1-like n=1 Tax=Haliotis rufescens TaxID=6454 RepID=UPI00201FA34E|nr:platelet endothelial aggregation receptor 1-like [Haliotis rufescens]